MKFIQASHEVVRGQFLRFAIVLPSSLFESQGQAVTLELAAEVRWQVLLGSRGAAGLSWQIRFISVRSCFSVSVVLCLSNRLRVGPITHGRIGWALFTRKRWWSAGRGIRVEDCREAFFEAISHRCRFVGDLLQSFGDGRFRFRRCRMLGQAMSALEALKLVSQLR